MTGNVLQVRTMQIFTYIKMIFEISLLTFYALILIDFVCTVLKYQIKASHVTNK